MTALSLSRAVLALGYLTLVGCGDPASGGAPSGSAAGPKPTVAASSAKTTAAATASASAATAPADDIPTEQDFEEAAETEITEATMGTELDAIAKEIDDDKE